MVFNEVKIHGVNYKQVNRNKAKELYEKGVTIYLIGNKANPFFFDGVLIESCVNTAFDGPKFESVINSFLYYLPRELGTYARFLVQID